MFGLFMLTAVTPLAQSRYPVVMASVKSESMLVTLTVSECLLKLWGEQSLVAHHQVR